MCKNDKTEIRARTGWQAQIDRVSSQVSVGVIRHSADKKYKLLSRSCCYLTPFESDPSGVKCVHFNIKKCVSLVGECIYKSHTAEAGAFFGFNRKMCGLTSLRLSSSHLSLVYLHDPVSTV